MSQAYKTYTDASKKFSLIYPENYTIGINKVSKQLPATAIDKVSLNFVAPKAPKLSVNMRNGFQVMAYQSNNTNALLNFYQTSSQISPLKNSTINGYKTVYQEISGSQPLAYTDDLYIVTNNNLSVVFIFRQTQSAINFPASNQVNIPAFNDSSNLPAFTALVKSIKFLN